MWNRLNAKLGNTPLAGNWKHCLVSEENRLIALILPGIQKENHRHFLQLLKAYLFAGFLMQHPKAKDFTIKIFWFSEKSLQFVETQRKETNYFLNNIVNEYTIADSYDLLPLEAIFEIMPAMPDNDGYINALQRKIEQASYNKASIAEKLPVSLKLSNLQIPQDAKDKVLRRFWEFVPDTLKRKLF